MGTGEGTVDSRIRVWGSLVCSDVRKFPWEISGKLLQNDGGSPDTKNDIVTCKIKTIQSV